MSTIDWVVAFLAASVEVALLYGAYATGYQSWWVLAIIYPLSFLAGYFTGDYRNRR